ncbi:hypothetical protein ACWGJQ_23465 [Peribacillus simplex]
MRRELSVFKTVLLIFAANDEMALGALRAVKARNMSTPVVGIDGNSEGARVN